MDRRGAMLDGKTYCLGGRWGIRISSLVGGEDILGERRDGHGRSHLEIYDLVSSSLNYLYLVLETWAPTTVVLAVVRDHEHDLPLEYITIDQSATDAWYIFVGLHLLELAAQEACRS